MLLLKRFIHPLSGESPVYSTLKTSLMPIFDVSFVVGQLLNLQSQLPVIWETSTPMWRHCNLIDVLTALMTNRVTNFNKTYSSKPIHLPQHTCPFAHLWSLPSKQERSMCTSGCETKYVVLLTVGVALVETWSSRLRHRGVISPV